MPSGRGQTAGRGSSCEERGTGTEGAHQWCSGTTRTARTAARQRSSPPSIHVPMRCGASLSCRHFDAPCQRGSSCRLERCPFPPKTQFFFWRPAPGASFWRRQEAAHSMSGAGGKRAGPQPAPVKVGGTSARCGPFVCREMEGGAPSFNVLRCQLRIPTETKFSSEKLEENQEKEHF